MNAQFRNEIMEVFDSFNDREDVRVAVLTGAGKVFCAGADIKSGAPSSSRPATTRDTIAPRAHNREASLWNYSKRLVESLEKRLAQRTETDRLFTIRWTVK